jgi:glucose/arabinose dehydrogenase
VGKLVGNGLHDRPPVAGRDRGERHSWNKIVVIEASHAKGRTIRMKEKLKLSRWRISSLMLAGLLCCAVADRAGAAVQILPFLSGLAKPVFVTNAKDGTARLFLVEQGGRIKVVQPGATTPTVFLDISTKIVTGGTGDERGLLGLAFHPDYARNRRFFVNYTRLADGATVIAEYHASTTDANVASTAETILLTISQPYPNHNGGMLAFGPDGYLYIGMGDGGSSNDPGGRAQDLNQLLGKILRIDINTPNGAVPYSSPPDNPFFGSTAGADEIYAYGLRNPWRWSFDRGGTRQLFVGDVGQGNYEEIDIVTRGGNYGWRIMEGLHCNPNFNGGACTPPANAIAPILEYSHGSRCSITGGYVYRGARSAVPVGAYIFGDYCSGEILQLYPAASGGTLTSLPNASMQISSFGEDEAGELYVAGVASGAVLRLAASPAPPPCNNTLAVASQTFSAASTSGSVAMTTSSADCAWLAASHDDWITLTSGTNGVGPGQISFSVAANTNTSSRIGTITAAGNTLTITQAGTQTGPPPRLTILRSGGNVILSWPTDASNFHLYRSLSLSPTGWSVDPSTAAIQGTNCFITNSLSSAPTRLYRLRQP